VPQDPWLEAWGKAAILEFERQYPLEGYRRFIVSRLRCQPLKTQPNVCLDNVRSLRLG